MASAARARLASVQPTKSIVASTTATQRSASRRIVRTASVTTSIGTRLRIADGKPKWSTRAQSVYAGSSPERDVQMRRRRVRVERLVEGGGERAPVGHPIGSPSLGRREIVRRGGRRRQR